MTYTIRRSTTFKKDFKLAKKRGFDIDKLKLVIQMIANNQALPTKFNDHKLIGNWREHRECHIEPNWLLIYRINSKHELELVRTGTHADLFNK